MTEKIMSVGAFCKSFAGDFDHLAILLESLSGHNPENIQLVLSLPQRDHAAFRARFGQAVRNVMVVADEAYCGHDLGRFPGWLAQQICKLMSWRVMDTPYYVILDSDCYLIRDFATAAFVPRDRRFIAYGSKIRTVLKEDNRDLLAYLRGGAVGALIYPQPFEMQDHLDTYLHLCSIGLDKLDPIQRSDIPMKTFGAKQWVYYQPGQIFCREVAASLIAFLETRGLSAGDLISVSPWEYNWYGEYIAGRFHDDTEFRVSPFVHVQDAADLAYASRMGLTEEALAARFFFVQMAARHLPQKRLGEG